jgi:hypothetical protein
MPERETPYLVFTLVVPELNQQLWFLQTFFVI